MARVQQDTTNLFPPGDAPEEVAAGVWRIPLPLPFALRSVNVYLVQDGPTDWTLIDSGLGLPVDDAALRAGLAAAGIALEDLTALVLTHAHPDHIGLSGPIASASGAPVYILAQEDEHLFTVWGGSDDDGVFARVEAMYRANGMPDAAVADLQAGSHRLRRVIRLPERHALSILAPDQTLRLGRHDYRVLWTPGHSDYHLCLLRDDGLFFAGDHVLPAITPNIGLYPEARPNPLADYFAALAAVRDLPVRSVLPGHGRPFASLSSRVDDLRAHHEERSYQLLALLAAQADGAHAHALAAALFGRRLVTPDDQRFALAETLAHLEYLRGNGRVAVAPHTAWRTYRAMGR